MKENTENKLIAAVITSNRIHFETWVGENRIEKKGDIYSSKDYSRIIPLFLTDNQAMLLNKLRGVRLNAILDFTEYNRSIRNNKEYLLELCNERLEKDR